MVLHCVCELITSQRKTIDAKQPMLSNEAMQAVRGAWVTSSLGRANTRHGGDLFDDDDDGAFYADDIDHDACDFDDEEY